MSCRQILSGEDQGREMGEHSRKWHLLSVSYSPPCWVFTCSLAERTLPCALQGRRSWGQMTKDSFRNASQQPGSKHSLRTEHDSIGPGCQWVHRFWTTESHNTPWWNEVWPQDQEKSCLSLQFHFCPLLQMKKTTFVDERTAQILQSSLCFSEVTVRMTAAVMNFNMKIMWTSPPIPQRTGWDYHAFHTGFFQASGSNCFWSLVAWTDTEMRSIPKDYKSTINCMWAATSMLPSSSTICKKVPWPLGFS